MLQRIVSIALPNHRPAGSEVVVRIANLLFADSSQYPLAMPAEELSVNQHSFVLAPLNEVLPKFTVIKSVQAAMLPEVLKSIYTFTISLLPTIFVYEVFIVTSDSASNAELPITLMFAIWSYCRNCLN